MKKVLLSLVALVLIAGCGSAKVKEEKTVEQVKIVKKVLAEDPNIYDESVKGDSFVVYQMMTRLFSNTNNTNKKYGTLEENGAGKFNDINDTALSSLKELGVTHMWYTGILEHATMTDYSKNGVFIDDADVVKGRAGSPYAIKDYYDVDPDLAVDVDNRIVEFENLVKRTHKNEMKVIIDFIPNHVSRVYKSDAKPEGVIDFGENDDVTKAFDMNNNFYYLQGTEFMVPKGYNPLGDEIAPMEDGKFTESPAKATGNDSFLAQPDISAWFETIKLNYGVDIENERATHFDPIPNTWYKMRDILLYWSEKGVDGFRCDMAEMVPIEFWSWAISSVREKYPDMLFMAESYNVGSYHDFVIKGKFDYMYDKVGLYETMKWMMGGRGRVTYMRDSWTGETKGISSNMIRFLENHDEQRVASEEFAENPFTGIPAMTYSATMTGGPVLIYFGQEVGEPGVGEEGFSSEDGRTTIFDYWGVPEHQKWVNGGAYDGGLLSQDQVKLRDFYKRLFNLMAKSDGIKNGMFYELYYANAKGQSNGYSDKQVYTYLRYSENQKLLIVVNFDQKNEIETFVKIPKKAWENMGLSLDHEYTFQDILNGGEEIKINASETIDRENPNAGVPVKIAPLSAYIYEIK